jgi:archaemetzincin
VKPIHLIPLGVGLDLVESLAASLARTFHTPCRIRPQTLEIDFALDPGRGQHHSTAILQRLERLAEPGVRVLAITSSDLYVPVLTFVFGEAQLEGGCAIVSTARLREEFYGLPARDDMLRDRLLKEATHEVGHTFGLRHCPDWSCVMASSHAVEVLDVKTADFCRTCRKPIAEESYW